MGLRKLANVFWQRFNHLRIRIPKNFSNRKATAALPPFHGLHYEN